jgi:hypothetical protein
MKARSPRYEFHDGDFVIDGDGSIHVVTHVSPGSWRRRRLTTQQLTRAPLLEHYTIRDAEKPETTRACLGRFAPAYFTFMGWRTNDRPWSHGKREPWKQRYFTQQRILRRSR